MQDAGMNRLTTTKLLTHIFKTIIVSDQETRKDLHNFRLSSFNYPTI